MKKRSAFPAIPALVALALVYMLSPGCGARKESPLSDDLMARCYLVQRESPAAGWELWLARHIKKSPQYALDRLHDAISASLKDDAVLMMAASIILPEHLNTLDDFVARGGRLLMLGSALPSEGSIAPRFAQATGAGLGAYTFTSSMFRASASGDSVELPAVKVSSLLPPSRGTGGDDAGPGRWIPVWEAAGPHGTTAGWAGSVLLTPQADAGFSICGWMSFDPPQGADRALESILARMITEMSRPAYLNKFGAAAFSYVQQKPVQAVAQIIDRRTRDFSPLRLAVRWIDRNGQEVRRHISEPLDSPSIRTELPAGLAPDPAGREPEVFLLELQIRDRNDLETLDSAIQTIKVFPSKNESAKAEVVTTSGTMLMTGRRPIFMLGVNYWPRLSARTAGTAGAGHWLNPGQFDPATLRSDLDLMAAAGINSIALEYTELSQAPQLLFVLDELRKRSMRANVYLPSLHPFDLRREEALALLGAINAAEWPELFAIEVARGIAVRSRADLRRLDEAWADWLDERFGSVAEAEQKLGVTIWRERGRIAGPPDTLLPAGPHQDRALALYFSFLQDYASRQIGYVDRLLRSAGYPDLLVTARSAYGWPDAKPESIADVLDIQTGAIHQDFLSPDAWTVHPLGQLQDDKAILAAYAAGAGNGKPLVWSAYGQHVGTSASAADLDRQKDVYRNYLETFLSSGASGAFAWWYPGGISSFHAEDWGLVEPDGVWRPVEEAIRAIRLQLRQTRINRPAPQKAQAPFNLSAAQWKDHQEKRTGIFSDEHAGRNIGEWTLPGTGLETRDLMNPGEQRGWSEIDGLHLLNSEWGTVIVDSANQERQPGENVRTYADRMLMVELINSGTLRWTPGGTEKTNGSVWVRITQPGFQEEWVPVVAAERGQKQQVAWTPRAPGLWEIQPHLMGYGKFGERIQVEVTTPPRLY